MRWIVCVLALLCLAGCGIREQVVQVDVPDAHANPQQGQPIEVGAVQDDRQSSFLSQFPASTREKNVGGVVRGGAGVNIILDSSTTTQKTRSIIVQALRNMGYKTAEHCDVPCPVLTPTLETFAVTQPFNFWRAASYSQHMVADIVVELSLQSGSHTSTFKVSGHGSNVYQIVSQENWEIALDRAAKDFSVNFKQEMAAHTDEATVNK